ncbi:MAG: hypothetical protein ABSH04_06775, partial [Acidimicrobiales bacterium]
MTLAIVLVIAAVVVTSRMWLRLRGRSTRNPRQIRAVSEPIMGDIGLVAAREVRERIRGKVFRVGTLITLAVVAAAIIVPVLHQGRSHPQQVGVVGALSAPLRAAVVVAGTGIGSIVPLG